MTILSKQYLESGTYIVSLEESLDTDLTSYVYTRFGTFKIIPISSDYESFDALEKYQVLLGFGLIGEVFVDQEAISAGSTYVAQYLASAIDIVTAKIDELLNQEERVVLSKIANYMTDSVTGTPEQKAMYRTFLIENNKLDDVIDEINTPTDIFGDNT